MTDHESYEAWKAVEEARELDRDACLAGSPGHTRRAMLKRITLLLLLDEGWTVEKDLDQLLPGSSSSYNSLKNMQSCGYPSLAVQGEHQSFTYANTRWRLTERGLLIKEALKEMGWYLADAE